MNRRQFLVVTVPGIAAWSAGCSSRESEGADPSVEAVEVPDVALPASDRLAAPPLPGPDEDPAVSETVENRGDAGDVHVSLTLLVADGEGTYTGQTARVRAVSLDAGESREVTFSDLPVEDYDRYQVQARPASLTAVVHNDGEDGPVVVWVRSRERADETGEESGEENEGDRGDAHEEETIAMAAGETAEVRFEGTYVQFEPENLVVEAAPAE